MSLEADLRKFLLTRSAVTNLVGTGNEARIRPYKFPQGHDDSKQSILIEVDDDDHLNDIEGIAGLTVSTVVLTCRAMTLEESEELAEAVRINGTNPGTGLAGYTGDAGDSNIDAVLESEVHSEVAIRDGSDNSYYDTLQTYIVSRNEDT